MATVTRKRSREDDDLFVKPAPKKPRLQINGKKKRKIKLKLRLKPKAAIKKDSKQNANNKALDPTGMRIPKKERYELPPVEIEHKLMVKSISSPVANLLCPIELLMGANNHSAPLIPDSYEKESFSMFQNVKKNYYVVSAPK